MNEQNNQAKTLSPYLTVYGFLIFLFIVFWLSIGCEVFHPTRSSVRTERNVSGIVVYVVRHAEKSKTDGSSDDPPLTERGKERAEALVQAIQINSLVAVYSTPFRRTRDTVAPAAKMAGLSITEIPAADLTGLIESILSHKKGKVLVAGHSNTVPEIIRRLGVGAEVVIGDEDFGDLFVVTLLERGKATLQKQRFGDKKKDFPLL